MVNSCYQVFFCIITKERGHKGVCQMYSNNLYKLSAIIRKAYTTKSTGQQLSTVSDTRNLDTETWKQYRNYCKCG